MHWRERNELVKDLLLKGHTVAFRLKGNFLYPRVWRGDWCTYEPIKDHGEIKVEDVVFCEVQYGNRFYAHLVKDIGDWNGRRCFTIANANGRVNGWCYDEHVYGKLIRVERGQ